MTNADIKIRPDLDNSVKGYIRFSFPTWRNPPLDKKLSGWSFAVMDQYVDETDGNSQIFFSPVQLFPIFDDGMPETQAPVI